MKIMRECFNPAAGSDSLIGEYLIEGFREGRDQGINGYLVHNVPEYADQYNYIVARYIPDKDELWFWGAWKDEKPALEAARDIDGQVIYRNGYYNDHNIANDYPSEETDECLKEDTIKQGKKWVNKGEDGTHGTFNTKKEADAQRKAMFANGYKEGLEEAKKEEDELPPDPEAVKLEVHNNLNNLVASEISTIDEYDQAKADILDAPIEHKDELISTIDHIKDEEKEHIDELINATSNIPFSSEAKTSAEINSKEEQNTDEAEEFADEDEWEDEVEESLAEDMQESILGVDKQYRYDDGAVDYSKLFPADILAIWNKVIDYAEKNGIKHVGMDFTNYADQEACIDAVCTDEEKDKLSSIKGNDGEIYSAYAGSKEDKEVDYVDYKHSYCHELEPKMKQLNYLCNVLKKPVGDIVKKVLGILKSAKDIKKTEKEQWFFDTIKNKKWNNSGEIYQFIKNSIKKAKEIEVTVDDNGELKKESLKEDTNLINTKVADVEYNDDDGYDCHVLLYLGDEDKTEEEIEDDLTEEGMIYVYVNDIFEKEIPAKNYDLYDVIESYDVPDGEGVSYTIGGAEYDEDDDEDDEWEDEDELTEYLVKGLQEHINDRPDPIEDKSEFKGQDNAVVDCPVSKLIAHSEDEKPLDCEMKKEPLPKNLTTK